MNCKIIAAAVNVILISLTGYSLAQTDAIRSQQDSSSASAIVANQSQSTLEVPTSLANPVLELAVQQPRPIYSEVLPSPFVGCWEGYVYHFDSLTPIGFLSSLMKAAHSTYTFCYLPNADGKTYRLEFRKVVIEEKELPQTAFENQVVWVDDAHRSGYLRDHLSAVQTGWLLLIPIQIHEEVYVEEIVSMETPDLIHMCGRELI